MDTRPPLRIGILADSALVASWEAGLVRRLNDSTSIDQLILIATGQPPVSKAESVWSRLCKLPFRFVRRLERHKLDRSATLRHVFERESVDGLVHDVIAVTPVWSSTGISWKLPEADLDVVRRLNLDVIIRMGSGIIRGEILSTARFGILSLHHGDNRKYRGVPPGFWEVLDKRGTSGFVLQRLTEELDGGIVVARGTVTTQSYFLRNQAHLFSVSVPRVVGVIEYLARQRRLPDAELPLPYSAPLYREPSVWPVARYVGQQASRLMRRVLRRILGRTDNWYVAITRQPWQEAALWKAEELEAAAGTWIADPFVVDLGGRAYCFVEEYVKQTGRGRIAVYDVTEGTGQRLGVAIEEPFHLSFPFVFEFDGELYMSPETADAGQIRVYRCLGDPVKWELASVLLDGVRAVDSMLVDLGDEWLLLTNVDETGSGDFATGVWAYRAQSPLSTNWTPDPMNPVVSDAPCLRNGGLLRDHDRLFRIGQVSDFDAYGTASSVQEILDAPRGFYTERTVAEIRPDFKPGLGGTHHLSSTGQMTAVDFYRR